MAASVSMSNLSMREKSVAHRNSGRHTFTEPASVNKEKVQSNKSGVSVQARQRLPFVEHAVSLMILLLIEYSSSVHCLTRQEEWQTTFRFVERSMPSNEGHPCVQDEMFCGVNSEN